MCAAKAAEVLLRGLAFYELSTFVVWRLMDVLVVENKAVYLIS